MHAIVFEDDAVGQLFPITTGRPAYSIACGSFRLVDWLRKLDIPMTGLVRPHLTTLQEVDYPDLGCVKTIDRGSVLLINARVVPSRTSFNTLAQIVSNNRVGIVRNGDEIAAAVVPSHTLRLNRELGDTWTGVPLESRDIDRLPLLGSQLEILRHPHDVVRFHMQIFGENIEARLESDSYREIRDGVFAAEGADLGDYIVSDTSDGPILLDKNSRIGPYCFLSGPAYLGPSSRVIEHSAIKDAVAIGHTCKIGGEVEASVIEPFTNKQHHGFLGHSYLGSWINLGAGTCNSDLKNTYGEVKMEYRQGRVATGMQFVGCIMGDYAKSAINTGIFTGKTIGVCSMLYGFVTTNVPSFTNYARSFGQVTEMSPHVMVSTQARMFERRNVKQRPCDVQLLHDMYELTGFERQIAGEPLSL